MPVAASVESHLAAKHAIDDHKVDDRQHHANRPPDQPNAQGVGSGERVGHGDVARRIAARGQQARVQRNRRTHQHGRQVDAGGGKGLTIRPAAAKIQDAAQ